MAGMALDNGMIGEIFLYLLFLLLLFGFFSCCCVFHLLLLRFGGKDGECLCYPTDSITHMAKRRKRRSGKRVQAEVMVYHLSCRILLLLFFIFSPEGAVV